METFFGRLKNEMYYGYKKDYSSFEVFLKAVEEYIRLLQQKKNSGKSKMNATCTIQDSIHVSNLVHNMCPEFWVHIECVKLFL